jgi:integrase
VATGGFASPTSRRLWRGVERSAATLEMHERHARYLLERLGVDTQLSEIDEEMLDRFVMSERAGRRVGSDGELRTVKPGTIKKRLFTLRLALKLARRRKLITHLPEWPQFTMSYKPRRRFLRSFVEYERLYDALPLPRAEWMSLCLWTAQHAGDVERMTWEDCDPFAQPPWMFIRNTKNRRDGIRVKMPAPLAEVLRAKWLRERPDRSSPIVDPWRNRGHELPRACHRLGLPALAAIDLRHTGLSWMIRKKGITKAAMEFAGHSSPTMMAKIYGHALPLQLLEVVEDLESIQHEPEAAIDLGRTLPPAGPGPSLSYPSDPPPVVAPAVSGSAGDGRHALESADRQQLPSRDRNGLALRRGGGPR